MPSVRFVKRPDAMRWVGGARGPKKSRKGGQMWRLESVAEAGGETCGWGMVKPSI
jgi:hypothetical protein